MKTFDIKFKYNNEDKETSDITILAESQDNAIDNLYDFLEVQDLVIVDVVEISADSANHM